jgi:hypothetical protein
VSPIPQCGLYEADRMGGGPHHQGCLLINKALIAAKAVARIDARLSICLILPRFELFLWSRI